MKFKKGDCFIVVDDVVDKRYNKCIGKCTGFNDDRGTSREHKYNGLIFIYNEYQEYIFDEKEVKKITKEEYMIEIL